LGTDWRPPRTFSARYAALNKVIATITGIIGGIAGGQLADFVGLLDKIFGASQGADVAGNAGRFGLRAELAWTRPRAGDDGRPAQRRADVHAVVGADRTFFDNLYVNVQLFGRHVSGFSDPYAAPPGAQRALDLQNAITFGQQDRDSLGYTLRVGDKWLQETLKADLLLVRNMTRSNSFVRAALSYAASHRWTLAGGTVHHQGAADTNFGRKRPGNRVFVELRYGL
jgi:hypothetical protein